MKKPPTSQSRYQQILEQKGLPGVVQALETIKAHAEARGDRTMVSRMTGLIYAAQSVSPETVTFEYVCDSGDVILWDIDKAKAAIARGPHPCMPLPPEQIALLGEGNSDLDPEKVAAADPTYPGIGAPLYWEGMILYVLIDGMHRVTRAWQTGQPFSGYLLTPAENRACVLWTSNPRLIP